MWWTSGLIESSPEYPGSYIVLRLYCQPWIVQAGSHPFHRLAELPPAWGAGPQSSAPQPHQSIPRETQRAAVEGRRKVVGESPVAVLDGDVLARRRARSGAAAEGLLEGTATNRRTETLSGGRR